MFGHARLLACWDYGGAKSQSLAETGQCKLTQVCRRWESPATEEQARARRKSHAARRAGAHVRANRRAAQPQAHRDNQLAHGGRPGTPGAHSVAHCSAVP
jgi:hypothetical protein